MVSFTRSKPIAITRALVHKSTNYRLGFFLILCLVLGGTSQDIVTPKLPLYLLSLVLIGFSFIAINANSYIWKLKIPALFFLLFFAANVIQLIPLPPSIWSALPGRANVQQGFELMDMNLSWHPISLAPEATLFSLFDFLPPLAIILCAGVLASKKELNNTIWCLMFFAVFTVVFGLLQVSGMAPELYFYSFTNNDSLVGFFSNANHQASFLLMLFPFSVGFVTMGIYNPGREGNTDSFKIVFGFASFIIFLVGLLLTSSVAGYVLLVPILFASLYLCTIRTKKRNFVIAILLLVLIAGLVFDFLFKGNYLGELLSEFTTKDHDSRAVIFGNTFDAAKIYFPFGSGLGSFSDAYKLHEEAWHHTIPHAHNDYLELLLELGLVAVILGGGFLLWWGNMARRILKPSRDVSKVMVKCACLSIFAILIHSVADYPLRTIGLSSLFVFFICYAVLMRSEFKVGQS